MAEFSTFSLKLAAFRQGACCLQCQLSEAFAGPRKPIVQLGRGVAGEMAWQNKTAYSSPPAAWGSYARNVGHRLERRNHPAKYEEIQRRQPMLAFSPGCRSDR